MKKPVLIALTAVLILPNFIDIDINEKLAYDHKEQFDPRLSNLNSIDKLEKYIDSQETAAGLKPDSVDYVVTISSAIRYRFYHGFSHFKLKDNWIAAIAEKIAGFGLACKVKTDDIMKPENAACSQQAMVMMDILKRKNIPYRSIGFPHHFALEVLVSGKWYYFDPNMEPNISNENRMELNWKCCADNLKRFYDTSRYKDLDWKFGVNTKVKQGSINQRFAGNVKIFQSTTAFMSKILWCFPLLLLFYRSRRSTLGIFKKLWLFLQISKSKKFDAIYSKQTTPGGHHHLYSNECIGGDT